MEEGVRHLKLLSVSKCSKDGETYMAILVERDGTRIMPVLMNNVEVQQLRQQVVDHKENVLPLSLADIMLAMFHQSSMTLEEVRIAAVEAGVTFCHVLYKENGILRVVRYCKAADGLTLAMAFGCPVSIHERLFEKQYMREVGDGTYSIPLNSVHLDALKETLERAVENEDYELASLLRDEIARRK